MTCAEAACIFETLTDQSCILVMWPECHPIFWACSPCRFRAGRSKPNSCNSLVAWLKRTAASWTPLQASCSRLTGFAPAALSVIIGSSFLGSPCRRRLTFSHQVMALDGMRTSALPLAYMAGGAECHDWCRLSSTEGAGTHLLQGWWREGLVRLLRGLAAPAFSAVADKAPALLQPRRELDNHSATLMVSTPAASRWLRRTHHKSGQQTRMQPASQEQGEQSLIADLLQG